MVNVTYYFQVIQLHELSLLFAYYLIKSRKRQVIYLGQSLPLNDLKVVSDIHHPEYIFTIFTSSPEAREVQEYINLMSKNHSDSKILVSGGLLANQEINYPDNVTYLDHVTDLTKMLNV
jgi:hypothetical protein